MKQKKKANRSPQPHDEMAWDKLKFLQTFKQDQKKKFEQKLDFELKEMNEIERSLSGQLMLLGTLTITVSAAFIGKSEIFSKLSPLQGFSFVLGVASIIASLAFGVCYYWMSRKHMQKWVDNTYAITEYLGSPQWKPLADPDPGSPIEKQKDLETGASKTFLFAQCLFLAVGVLIYLWVFTVAVLS